MLGISDRYGARAPRIITPNMRDFDRKKIRRLQDSLNLIERQVDAFYSGVTLYIYAKAESSRLDDDRAKCIWRQWSMIGAREGALRLPEVREAIQSLNGRLRDTFGDDVHKVSPSPDDMLRQSFPGVSDIRHSAAHTVMKLKNDDKIKEHTFSGDVELVGVNLMEAKETVITDTIVNDEYVGTWNGKIAKYAITIESVEKLELVKLACFAKLPPQFVTDAGY